MCLMLYLATSDDQPLRSSPDLNVEEVENTREAVRQWFSLPTVRFIGAHTGCSCGFPSVVAEEPVEYYDRMFGDDEDREADLRSVRSLIELLRDHLSLSRQVEMYPVWDGDEGLPPKGTINLRLDAVDARTFVFSQQFLYRVTRAG